MQKYSYFLRYQNRACIFLFLQRAYSLLSDNRLAVLQVMAWRLTKYAVKLSDRGFPAILSGLTFAVSQMFSIFAEYFAEKRMNI